MAPTQGQEGIDFTRTQLAVFFTTILLAVDAVNPVKIFMHVFPAVAPWHIATLCIVLMLYVFIKEMKSLLYYGVKIFFHSILSIFFREVETIGRHNIPRYGPVIFTVNHANQFMDAVMVMCTCEHKISYLMAEASWKRRIVGDLAWAMEVVPVKRAQDDAFAGTGKIRASETEEVDGQVFCKVLGSDTAFRKELNVGDKIRPAGSSIAHKIMSIQDDGNLVVEPNNDGSLPETPVTFDILKRVDQKIVYEKVLDKLASGGAVGIFPEGGSHDRTELLPLKVGIALIAYSALEKDGINIPIVPVGLSYFQAHRWRGRAVVEYGEPILIDPATLLEFKAGGVDRRRVCSQLLENIEDSMKSVLVSTPDFDNLQLIHTARRLYQRTPLEASERQDLTRRFAEGYKRLLLMTEGKPPAAWIDLQERIVSYRKELRELGIRDYQVPGLDHREGADIDLHNVDGDFVLREMELPFQIAHLLFLLCLAAIPTLFLNLPVGVMAGLWSESRRKRALAKSKVKIRGYDVMLTEKVVFCIAMVPTLWMVYGVLLMYFTNFDGPTVALCFMSMPLCAYMGIIVAEAGIVGWKDVRPYFLRLFPSTRRRLAALPATRRGLQTDLRAFIRRLGPALGEIYYGKDLDWKTIQKKTKKLSNPDLREAAEEASKKEK